MRLGLKLLKSSLDEQWRASELDLHAENYRREHVYFNSKEKSCQAEVQVEKLRADAKRIREEKKHLRIRRIEEVQQRRREKIEQELQSKCTASEFREVTRRRCLEKLRAEKKAVDMVTHARTFYFIFMSSLDAASIV
jgi:hypothetical protein